MADPLPPPSDRLRPVLELFVYQHRRSLLDTGLQLYLDGKVHRMWFSTHTQTLHGKVRDGSLLTQSIALGSNLVGRTNCSGGNCEGTCPHILAVLIAYLEGWDGLGADTEGVDLAEEQTRRKSAAPAAKTGTSSKPEKTTRQPLPPASKASVSQTGPGKDLSILGNLLAHRFGIKLKESEKKITALVDQIYQKNTPMVSVDTLLAIAGHSGPRRYYYDPPVSLWPSHLPPSSITEAWYYTAEAIRNHVEAPRDGFILQHVPWDEVEQFLAGWKREVVVREWREQLEAINKLPELPPPASPSFRLLLRDSGGQIQKREAHAAPDDWGAIKNPLLREYLRDAWPNSYTKAKHTLDEDAIRFLRAFCPESHLAHRIKSSMETKEPEFAAALNILLRSPAGATSVVTTDGRPLPMLGSSPAAWSLEELQRSDKAPVTGSADTARTPHPAGDSDYVLGLRLADGSPLPNILALLPGQPNLAVTLRGAYPVPGPPLAKGSRIAPGAVIPAAAIESQAGLAALDRLRISPPARVSGRIQTVPMEITVQCELKKDYGYEVFRVQAVARSGGLFPDEFWQDGVWKPLPAAIPAPAFAYNHQTAVKQKSASASASASAAGKPNALPASGTITRLDRSLQAPASAWLQLAQLSAPDRYFPDAYWMQRRLNKQSSAAFPDEFLRWLDQRPRGLITGLDPELAALRDHGRVSAVFSMEVEESGIDWFDLTLHLKLSDLELTQKEIDLLLKHTGSWIRLPDRGWRRLDLALTEEQQRQLADLGLSPADVNSGEKQRLHTLQLAHPAATGLLTPERAAEVQRRASELRTSVTPPLPAAITATLRPYQTEGWHFLAYLSTNRFGGILADDMGLGKTLQALTWLAWLHETGQLHQRPILVVCPKSVQDNWTSEAARFFPSLPVRQWTPANTGDLTGITPVPSGSATGEKTGPKARNISRAKTKTGSIPEAAAPPLLLVINYTQLRLHADALTAVPWSAVILDEAQYIKNPASQTAKTAFALTSLHRLALSGTPIENRLLDLWSIMAFAMPGVLSNRSQFAKNFGAKDDPLARRRLGARVRPFVLRRTKKEVAADLPDRIEEDLVCALEGPQLEQYQAELKLARATLLKAKTSAQLDKLRFNILTSLLRLRQICCHPRLTGKGDPEAESAKLNALLELLEPLIEEGHKVLIFSQFVEMLHLISAQLEEREWPHLVLTGGTEDRGALVREFQESEGANLFLISLKAGGSGLNLTAASYVVLFDPWWNPAVENQAIDRTHRIGQVNKVIAYRLITRDTIEEKIRQLQKSKSALAADILGEETFAKALTLDDFQFLLNP